jgi:hypothetical protein
MFRSRRRLGYALAAALTIGALAAPAANAVTGEEFGAGSAPQSTPAAGSVNNSDQHPTSAVGSVNNSDLYSASAAGSSNSPEPTVSRTIDDGFDLGSAAIGAGIAAAVLLLGGAGAAVVSRHRRRVSTVG